MKLYLVVYKVYVILIVISQFTQSLVSGPGSQTKALIRGICGGMPPGTAPESLAIAFCMFDFICCLHKPCCLLFASTRRIIQRKGKSQRSTRRCTIYLERLPVRRWEDNVSIAEWRTGIE
eukprot:6208137-Pleurochrysis_carterae.AAC.1